MKVEIKETEIEKFHPFEITLKFESEYDVATWIDQFSDVQKYIFDYSRIEKNEPYGYPVNQISHKIKFRGNK